MARKDNMDEKRRYKRFSVDIMEINGKMASATHIKILDISTLPDPSNRVAFCFYHERYN